MQFYQNLPTSTSEGRFNWRKLLDYVTVFQKYCTPRGPRYPFGKAVGQ